MEYTAIVDKYLKYMWNADIWQEFRDIFRPGLAEHLINKFETMCERYGRDGAAAIFWQDIDVNCQNKIMERAIQFE